MRAMPLLPAQPQIQRPEDRYSAVTGANSRRSSACR